MTPNYTPGDIMRNRPQRAAIYRRPTKAKFTKYADNDVGTAAREAQTKATLKQNTETYVNAYKEGGIKEGLMALAGGKDFGEKLFLFMKTLYPIYRGCADTIRKDEKESDGQNNWYKSIVLKAAKNNLEPIVDARMAEARQYRQNLKKYHEKRFGSVKGPIYDPDKGWNPGYRVRQIDLMTAMSSNPFEAIHPRMDIPIGVPWPDPEVNSIGYMPFKWRFYTTGNQLWNAPMVADPILFEMERAFQREQFWATLWNKVFTNPVKIEKGFGFVAWNTQRGGHLAGAFDN